MPKKQDNYSLFWFRRDLRLYDNAGLYQALKQTGPVLPVFIFDSDILKSLPSNDARVPYIWDVLNEMKSQLQNQGSDLHIYQGQPLSVFKKVLADHEQIQAVYCNHDYEPAARDRDAAVLKLCQSKNIEFRSFKDQVIFEKDEVLTDAGKPYSVFTPYKRKWLSQLHASKVPAYTIDLTKANWKKIDKQQKMPALKDIGFVRDSSFSYPQPNTSKQLLVEYAKRRDFPALNATSYLGLSLRFGTVSVREMVSLALKYSPVWLSELIWREFFMQILFHFPQVEKKSYRTEFEQVQWRENKKEFELWCQGRTGYPLVDAGMRELNQTGFMHNRVRMVTASFLTKHLLMHWRLGERYFAQKLLDYDLAANNGNWQWVAGTGCDAAPYFRIFNPQTQIQKFDPDYEYIKKWVPEWGTDQYPEPMVNHAMARDRALRAFAKVKNAKKVK